MNNAFIFLQVSSKHKGISEGEDISLYVDELKNPGEDKAARGLQKINETMTTSLDYCQYAAEDESVIAAEDAQPTPL